MARVIVVKYGGSAMEDPVKVMEILREISLLVQEGFSVVLVHGGGKEISGEMERRGLKAVFAQGFRVTDEAAMAVVEEVLDQRVNPGIVKKLNELGGQSRGMSGREVFYARKAAKVGGVDLGRVGEVERCEVGAIERCLEMKVTAVVSPVGQGDDGKAMNVNADAAASALAGALRAERLIFISDVPGLMRRVEDPMSLLREVREGEYPDLEKEGVIQGGMLPKCRAAMAAIKQGLERVEFVDGRVAGTLGRVVRGQAQAGTTLLP